VAANVAFTLNMPVDCTAAGSATQNVPVASLAVSVATPVAPSNWSVTCTQPSNHNFTVTVTISVTTANVNDGVSANNSATSSTGTTAVTKPTDVSVSSVTVDAPAGGTAGVAFNVTVNANLANSGGVNPVNVDTTFSLTVPGSCSKLPIALSLTTTSSLLSRLFAQGLVSHLHGQWLRPVRRQRIGRHRSAAYHGLNSVNNGRRERQTTIVGAADLKVTSVTVTAPASANRAPASS
jgi:hypothetical protein